MDLREGNALVLNRKRRMGGSPWSEDVTSTTFSSKIPRQSSFNWSVQKSTWEKLLFMCSRGCSIFLSFAFVSLPPPNLSSDHSSWNRLTEQSCGSVCATGHLSWITYTVKLSIFFRQTVQWSMILESSMSNGVIYWTESFTLVILSIERTTSWMFCRTSLITCEWTGGQTNGG